MRLANPITLSLVALLSLSAPGQQIRIEAPKPADYALYAGVMTMRGLDFWSTERVLDHGGRELILPAGLVKNPIPFAAFEVGMGALDIYSSRLIARHHLKLARTMLAVHISTTAAVVGHNVAEF